MGRILKDRGGDSIDPTLLELGGKGVVISRERLLATGEAREILDRAREEAARLRGRAEEVLREAIQEKEEERQRGFEQGREEGLAQVTERLVEIERERERLVAGQEKEIVEMVLEIAKKVIARELKKGAIVDIVRQALRQAVGDRVVIRLHPSDKEKFSGKEVIEETRTVTIEGDEAITPGGCVVETELGTVDARLETQWEAIRKALALGEER